MASVENDELQAGLDEITEILQDPEHENFDAGLIVYKYLLLLSPQEILDYVKQVYGVDEEDAHDYLNLDATNDEIKQMNAANYRTASGVIQTFIYATRDVPQGFQFNPDAQVHHSTILAMLVYLDHYIYMYEVYAAPGGTDNAGQTLDKLNKHFIEYHNAEFGHATTEERAQANTQYNNTRIAAHQVQALPTLYMIFGHGSNTILHRGAQGMHHHQRTTPWT